MNLDIRIPFDSDKSLLGAAYNRAMETVEDWALFLDHDVFLAYPAWYGSCKKAIQTLGHCTGLISCRTNAVACPHQIIKGHGGNHNLDYHTEVAMQRATDYAGQYTDITDAIVPISGFFILTHKKAWQDAGGFSEGFLGVDNEYHRRIQKAGYRVFIIEELYCYHRYKRTWASKNIGIPRN